MTRRPDREPSSPANDNTTSETEIAGWFAGRLPDGWFTGAAEITVDREEILVIGRIPEPEETGKITDDTTDTPASEAAEQGRIARFREDTRADRIKIARQAERTFGRKVAWGVDCGSSRKLFTTISVPVMTRLRQPERRVLDTLVDAGVARSRSDALGWCVRLVGEHSESWLVELRDALTEVERVREQGPA